MINYFCPGFPIGSDGKESACNVGDLDSIPGLGRSPGGRHSNSLQYSCLENPHEQRSLAGYSSWGHKVLDMTAWLSTALPSSFFQDFLIVFDFWQLDFNMPLYRYIRFYSIWSSLSFLTTAQLHSSHMLIMLKILQARLQQYVNRELPDVQVGFRKGLGTRD